MILTAFLVKFNTGIFGQPPGITYVDFVFEGTTDRLDYLSNPGAPVEGAKIFCSVTIESYDEEVYLHQQSYVYSDGWGIYEEEMEFEVPTSYYDWPDDFEVTKSTYCVINSEFTPVESEVICEELGLTIIDYYGFEPSDDSDNNGVPDELELALAQKFAPQIYGHKMATNISPEPFRIMGGTYNTDIHVSLWNEGGDKYIDNVSLVNGRVELYSVSSQQWKIHRPWAGTEYDYHNLFNTDFYFVYSSDYSQWRVWNESKTQIIDSGPIDVPLCIMKYNFDWPGGEPSEWRDAYTSGSKDGDLYEHTIYATVFETGSVCAIQYWFFYPYNDWVNDHEGDIEHINVVTTSLNPSEADIDFVDYYFHKKVKRCDKNLLIQYGSIIANTHPIVYTGGRGTFPTGSGDNSGGSYPETGFWENVAPPGIDENVWGLGVEVAYTVFSTDNNLYDRQGLEILKDPTYEDYGAHKWLSWNSVKIAIGEPTGIFPFISTKIYCPYYSGGWRQLGDCGNWSYYY